MTTKQKYILYGALAIAILLVIIAILYKNRSKGALRFAGSSFTKLSADNALAEYKKWGNGTKKETAPEMLADIEKYWLQGAGVNWKGQKAISEPWSAAFISYIMKKSGAGNNFRYATSHSTYITDSISNRKNNNQNPFKGYRINEVYVQPGDLVCYARAGSGANYDTTGSYASHCDLVVYANDDIAETIGGNVSNSVSKTIVPLKSGKIDLTKTSKPYFVVIKNENS